MSFKNLSVVALVVLLYLLYLQNKDNSAIKPTTAVTGQALPSPELPDINKQPSQLQDQSISVEPICPFPMLYDLKGARFQLNFNSNIDSANLERQLVSAADELLNTYSNWLETDTISGLRLNVQVLSEQEFNRLLTGKVANPNSYLGVFLAANNLAVIKYVSPEQALATAIHELTHAVNYAIFGPIPRFINEGLAEYIERGSIGSRTEFVLPKGVTKQQAKAELLDFYSLMHSEQDWHSSNNASLYFSGSAWAHFLMSSELGLQSVKMLLQDKASSPCQPLDSELIIRYLSEQYPNFEQDFYYWFDER